MIKKALKNKELLWTFVYQATTLFGGLLLIKLLAVTLSKNNFGYYSLVMSLSALVIMLPFSAFMQGISRYISIYQTKMKYSDFFTVVMLLNIFIIFIYMIISIISRNVISLDNTWNILFYFIVTFIATEIIKILYRTINNANRERKNIALSTFSEFFIKVGFLYTCSLYISISIKYLLIIFIMANLIAILIMYINNKNNFNFNTVTFKSSKVIFMRIWLFSSPLLIWAVFGWLRDMSNRWYLDYFLDKEHVALFAMMSSIAMIAPTALLGLIGGYFMPILYQKENMHKGYTRRFLYKMLPLVGLFFIFSFIITYFFKDTIILIIADEKYLEISWMLPWMFLIFCLYTLSMMSTYEIFAYKQTKKLILSSIVPGLVSMIFGYFFIKSYGIDGALYNYIITYLSYSLLTFYVVYKYSKSNKIEINR